ELSVAENIFLGHAPRGRFGLIDRRAMIRQAGELLRRIGATVDPALRLRDLGIANKHLVAIARALSIDARVVIMDEPTAALSHKEIHELYALIERLKAEGKAILFISHKFDEIFRIADRWTVFRDGQYIGAGR
ncbi:sugar ABC transporter ATP-binding protein, partial [Thioclava sp. BHET1]